MTNYENGYADKAAKYWTAPVTKREFQNAIDGQAQYITTQMSSFGQALNSLMQNATKLDALGAFLLERSGIAPEEFQKWFEARVAEFTAKLEVVTPAAEETPADGPKVTLE